MIDVANDFFEACAMNFAVILVQDMHRKDERFKFILSHLGLCAI